MIHSLLLRIKNNIPNLSTMALILIGFLTTFAFFFLIPVFMGPSQSMQIKAYVPANPLIGADFTDIISSTSLWLRTATVPPILYPPLTLFFFAPFTLLNLATGYKIIVIIIIACYLLMTMLLPRKINPSGEVSTFLLLISITGILCYGLQFELERGQWNVITVAFSLTAIYLFHYHPKHRWLAYILFSISVQLKLYPAIFVFVLIEDWPDWKNNIKRIAGLGILNVMLVFVFGLDPIIHSIQGIDSMRAAHNGNPANLSISSFTAYFLSQSWMPQKRIVLWLMANNWPLQLFFFVFFILCFVLIFREAYRKKLRGFNPHIFLACAIGACIIPPVSFDYKLSILPACIAISMPGILNFNEPANKPSAAFLTFIFSVAYSSTLYSYILKPALLQNNFPALLIILVVCTALSLRKDGAGENKPESGENGQGLHDAQEKHPSETGK